MLKTKPLQKLCLSLLLSQFLVSVSFSANANLFTAYPGKYGATLIGVDAANTVKLNIDVWAGYPRNLRITLPDIVVPEHFAKEPACHSKLVEEAINYTQDFMANAKKIEVRDIQMYSTDEQDAVTEIYTEKGSLGAALSRKGLARPATTKAEKPWC